MLAIQAGEYRACRKRNADEAGMSSVESNKSKIRVYLDLWIVNTLFGYVCGRLGGPMALKKNVRVGPPQRGRRRRRSWGEPTVILGRLRLPKPLPLEDKSYLLNDPG